MSALMQNRARRRHTKGQEDHVDAWLMSYADLITLLFMLFVCFVSVSVSRDSDPTYNTLGEAPHPWINEHFGILARGFKHDALFASLTGVVVSNHADQHIGLEKTSQGLRIDLSAVQFFQTGSADIPGPQMPLLMALARAIKNGALATDIIEVEGYTDDEPLGGSRYANNWELSAMRAARIAAFLNESGIDASRLHTESYASSRPVVPNLDVAGKPIPENRTRNQRVVIKVSTPQ